MHSPRDSATGLGGAGDRDTRLVGDAIGGRDSGVRRPGKGHGRRRDRYDAVDGEVGTVEAT